MTKDEFYAYIAQKEQEHNLAPGELAALVRQESGGSLDTGLRGQELSRGRGAAIGPWQVVPAYHPDFPAGGGLKAQTDYAANFYANSGKTQEDRLRRYYGTGTAPKGHPTTDQYVQQTMGRMPQGDNQQGQTMDDSELFTITEDPQQRRAAYQLPQVNLPPGYYSDIPEPPQREPGKMERWLADPLTQMGMGILMASGSPWAAPLGYGMASASSGINEGRRMENELYDLQVKREEARRKRYQDDRRFAMDEAKFGQEQFGREQLLALADQYESQGDILTAAKIRAGIKSGLDTNYSTSPNYVTKDGKTYIMRLGSDGKTIYEEVKGTPFAVESKTPGFAGAVSQSQARGKTIGEAEGKATTEAPKTIQSLELAAKTANELLNHEGEYWTTGIYAHLPESVFKGTAGYDYLTKLNQAKGQIFLQAFETLKGGGQITEIEGTKATQALAALERGQTKEARDQALRDLAEIATIGAERARRNIRLSPEEVYKGGFGGATSTQTAPTAPATPAAGGWSIKKKGG